MLYDLKKDLKYIGAYCCEFMCDIDYSWTCPICNFENSIDGVDEDTKELNCDGCNIILVISENDKWHNKKIATLILDKIKGDL